MIVGKSSPIINNKRIFEIKLYKLDIPDISLKDGRAFSFLSDLLSSAVSLNFDSRSTAGIYSNLNPVCSRVPLFKRYNFKKPAHFPSLIARSLLKTGATVAWAVESLVEHF